MFHRMVVMLICVFVEVDVCWSVSPTQNRLREISEEILRCRGPLGASIIAVRDDQVVFRHNYGHTDLNRTHPVTSETKFCLGSLTKAFTSTLLAKLINKKKVSWDDPINTYLKKDIRFSSDYLTGHVNLRDILAHRTGYPPNDLPWAVGALTIDQVIDRLNLESQLSEFRTSFSYNNVMYAVAGKVAEQLGGKRWKELVKEHLLDPLNMTSSTFLDEHTSTDNMAMPHLGANDSYTALDFDVLRMFDAIAAAASLCSSPSDMAKWMNFQLNDGMSPTGSQVVPKEPLQQTRKPSNIAGSTPTEKLFMRPRVPVTMTSQIYALGWFNGWYRGLPTLSHSGTALGITTHILLVPSKKIGIFLSMNSGAPYLMRVLLPYITDILLGEEPWLNQSTACSFPEPFVTSPPTGGGVEALVNQIWSRFKPGPGARNLPVYEGTYGNQIMGNITIYVDQSTQHLRMKYGIYTARLELRVADIFIVKPDGAFSFYNIYVAIFKFERDGTSSLLLPLLGDTSHSTFWKNLQYKKPTRPTDPTMTTEGSSPTEGGSSPSCPPSNAGSPDANLWLSTIILATLCSFYSSNLSS